MLNMNYIPDDTIYPVNFTLISENIVELKGKFPIYTDGFYLSRPGHDDKWDYSGYTTVYRETEDGVQFSNDGSVYVPPELDDESLQEIQNQEETDTRSIETI